MRRPLARLAIFFALFAPVLLDVAVAEAQRVAIARFSGSRASSLRPQLVRSLRDGGLETISDRDQRDAANNAGVRFPIDELDIATVCPVMGADYVIYADVRRAAGQWELVLRVYDAQGNELGGHTFVESSAGALRRPVRESGYAVLRQFLAGSGSGDAQSAAGGDTESTGGSGTESAGGSDEPGGSSAWYQGENERPPGQGDGDEDGDGDNSVGEDEEPRARDRRPRRDAIRIQLDGGSLHRDFVANTRVSGALRPPFTSDLALPEERAYRSGGIGHFELGGRVEFFPGAFFDRGIAASFGLGVEVGGGLGLAAEGPACTEDALREPGSTSQRRARCGSNEGETVDVGASQLTWAAGFVFDHLFDRPGLGLRLDIGYGQFLWNFDTEAIARLQRDAIIPPMAYQYMNFGAGVRYHFTKELGVQLRGAFMYGLDIGQDAKDIWGRDTSGNFLGWRAGGDIMVDLSSQGVPGVYASIGGEVFQFLTDFAGQPTCTADAASCSSNIYDLWEYWPSPEGDPESVASNAGITETVSDFYWQLQFSVGYAFRPR